MESRKCQKTKSRSKYNPQSWIPTQRKECHIRWKRWGKEVGQAEVAKKFWLSNTDSLLTQCLKFMLFNGFLLLKTFREVCMRIAVAVTFAAHQVFFAPSHYPPSCSQQGPLDQLWTIDHQQKWLLSLLRGSTEEPACDPLAPPTQWINWRVYMFLMVPLQEGRASTSLHPWTIWAQIQFFHMPAWWSWACGLTSPGLSFLDCKMSIITVSTSEIGLGWHRVNTQ